MATLELFNEAFYLAHNPDVHEAVKAGQITAREHFFQWGKTEGRHATPLFNPTEYLELYPDVAAAVQQGHINAYDHFITHGVFEGRKPFTAFDVDHYLARNADVAAAVAVGQVGALEHFMLSGRNEGRDFSPSFEIAHYLNTRPELSQAVHEGRVSVAEYVIQDLIMGLADVVHAPTMVTRIETGGHVGGHGDPAPGSGPDVGGPGGAPNPGEPGGGWDYPQPGTGGGQGETPAVDAGFHYDELIHLLNQVDWWGMANDSILQQAYFSQNLGLYFNRLGDWMPPALQPHFRAVNVNDLGISWHEIEGLAWDIVATEWFWTVFENLINNLSYNVYTDSPIYGYALDMGGWEGAQWLGDASSSEADAYASYDTAGHVELALAAALPDVVELAL